MRCYHGNQMVNKLQLHSFWKWLQTYWVSVGWGQRQRTWCHDNQGGRRGEMPWLNQEWCQSPTECNQLVSPCLFVCCCYCCCLPWVDLQECLQLATARSGRPLVHTHLGNYHGDNIPAKKKNVASGFVFRSLIPVYVTCITKVGKNLVTFSDVPRH